MILKFIRKFIKSEVPSQVWHADKENSYQELVKKRKACCLCKGLTNPSDFANGKYDSDHIGPWSLWQHNLNADIVIVGQDWGGTKFFERWSGRDPNDGNTTNENLLKLLKSIGVMIGKPREDQMQQVFFTNLILCLKTGGLQSPVKDDWFNSCASRFFRPLIEIIKPKAILALGQKSSEFILDAYEISYKSGAMKTLLNKSPFRLSSETLLFPLYHCGARGININHSFDEQLKDWKKVAKIIEKPIGG